MDLTEPDPRLSRWEWAALAVLFVAFVAFGVVVEVRSTYLSRRMGDLSVYAAAAWSVREHNAADLYTITDSNGWHYNYPPLLAILMSPLADPPPGADRAGYWSYPFIVAAFYAVNLLLLVVSVHVLASAFEQASRFGTVRTQERWGRRWWGLRVVPILVCLPPIGHTMMRGQANLLLLALVCGMAAALLYRRSLTAGVCLAGAVCLKIFPGFLLLYPLWRRDGRVFVGCALGLVVGLLLIPAVVLGPARTVACYEQLADGLVRPALGQGGDAARDNELIKVTATDSQSFLSVIHKTWYLDPATRPDVAAPVVKHAHLALGGLFTLLTLAAAGWRRPERGPAVVLFVGALALLMMVLSPVCHTHYFALCLPLVMALLAEERERRGTALPSIALCVLLGLHLIGNVLPLLPACEMLKDGGAALYAALLLWGAGCVALRRRPAAPIALRVFQPAAA